VLGAMNLGLLDAAVSSRASEENFGLLDASTSSRASQSSMDALEAKLNQIIQMIESLKGFPRK
jgi:hypothetical protein